jgi:HSP20 family protein
MKQKNGLNITAGPPWTESSSGFSSLFDDFSGHLHFKPDFQNSGVTTPAVNIIETRKDLRVEMVAPGMKKEAFKVELQKEVLTISYEHDDNREGERKDWKYRVREYNYHSFMRSFCLPDIVESDKIEANYTDGVLTLRIPKKKEAITRQITVE